MFATLLGFLKTAARAPYPELAMHTLKKISLPSWVATFRLMVSTSGLASSSDILAGVVSAEGDQ